MPSRNRNGVSQTKAVRSTKTKPRKKSDVFVELLRELIAALMTFHDAHSQLIKIIPGYEEHDAATVDPLVAPLAFACLDAAYAFKEILKSGKFDFVNFEDPALIIEALDRTRARKRHPQHFIPNTIQSGRSRFTGINVCYGMSNNQEEWQCRCILLSGAAGNGPLNKLQDGLFFNKIWSSITQIALFVGPEKPVNLTLLLLNFMGFSKKLISHLESEIEKAGSGTNSRWLQDIQGIMDGKGTHTFTYSLVQGKP